MKKERFKITPAVFLVIIKENKIFLMKRYNTGHEDGNYSFPAGHVDGNETLRQAICREAKEEANISIKPEDLILVNTSHRLSKNKIEERLDFYFMPKTWSGKPKIMEPDKCDGLGFFNIYNLPDNTIDYIKKVIENIIKKENYTEFGWD